jgi:hypothetical protein
MNYDISKRILFSIIVIILISSVYVPMTNSIRNISQNTEYDLLIISPKEFKDNLIPLVTHKLNMGVSAIIKDMKAKKQQMGEMMLKKLNII